MKRINTRQFGFTLVEIMIVVSIIGLLAAIAIPNFIKARANSQKYACIANLKQLAGAKGTWAMENKRPTTDVPADTDLFGPNLYIRQKPICPAGGDDYIANIGDMTEAPTCSLGATDGHTL